MLDPFALPENEFIGMYRLTKDMIRNLINALELHLPPRKRTLGIGNELKVNKICIALQGGPPFGHEPLTALEQWKASRHWPLCKWLVSNRYVVNRDLPHYSTV